MIFKLSWIRAWTIDLEKKIMTMKYVISYMYLCKQNMLKFTIKTINNSTKIMRLYSGDFITLPNNDSQKIDFPV